MKKTGVTIGAGRTPKHLSILFKKHSPLGMPSRRQQAIPREKVKLICWRSAMTKGIKENRFGHAAIYRVPF
jgi:hypothetical protein